MNEDNFVWLSEPIHKNRFKPFKFDEHPEIMDFVTLSFDGSVVSVFRDKVEELYKKNEVDLIKTGHKKMPKISKIETAEQFFEAISYFAEF